MIKIKLNLKETILMVKDEMEKDRIKNGNFLYELINGITLVK